MHPQRNRNVSKLLRATSPRDEVNDAVTFTIYFSCSE